MLVKLQPSTEALETLKALFPEDHVELRNGKPTLWTEKELDGPALFSIAAVASQHKMGFTLKRSGKSIRTILG